MLEPEKDIKYVFLTINHNITSVQEKCFLISFEGCGIRGRMLTGESWEDAEIKARRANPKEVYSLREKGKPWKIRWPDKSQVIKDTRN